MDNRRNLFMQMPDTVAVTDAYGYVLDFNRNNTVRELKKGLRLTGIFPDVLEEKESVVEIGEMIFRRVTTPVLSGQHTIGYTVIFTDITEEVMLARQNTERRKELEELAEAKKSANRKLSDYAMEVKSLSDYAEQLRIARSIHDDSGHAVTEIHAICQMCLQLMNKDLQSYRELLEEGIKICRKASSGSNTEEYESLREMAETFARRGSFPLNIITEGTEPAFMKERYGIVARMLKESYHNTLEHSLADAMDIRMEGSEERFTLTIRDNGSFRGPFEKGFGLLAKDYVKASGGEISFLTEEGEGFGIVATWRKPE